MVSSSSSRSFEDDEAELYDPDDPNSDWGQAVQEALQDWHGLAGSSNCRNGLSVTGPDVDEMMRMMRFDGFLADVIVLAQGIHIDPYCIKSEFHVHGIHLASFEFT